MLLSLVDSILLSLGITDPPRYRGMNAFILQKKNLAAGCLTLCGSRRGNSQLKHPGG